MLGNVLRTRIKALTVAALVAGMLTPVAHAASPSSSTPITIAGTVTDPLGPADAEVCAYASSGLVSAVVAVTGARTDAEGRYTLTLVPGEYRIRVRSWRSSSPCSTVRQDFDKYTHQSRQISTVTNLDDIDFAVKFHLTNAVVDYGSRPGGYQQVGGFISQHAGDDVRMYWDDGAGHTYEVTPKRSWGEPYDYGHPIWLYQFDRTVPDLPDGTYTGTLWVESDAHPGAGALADPSTETYIIDSTAPDVVATFPADGANDAATQRSYVRFDAVSGSSGATMTSPIDCFNSHMVLDDITDGGRTRIVPLYSIGSSSGSQHFERYIGSGSCRSDDPYDLEPSHLYEATLIVKDAAHNATTHSFTFSGYDGPDLYAPSPTGVGPAPDRISVGYSPDAATSLSFAVSRIDGDLEMMIGPGTARYDPATRTAWIESDARPQETISSWWPVLEPGTYRVEVTGRDRDGADLDPLVWQFEVAAPLT